MQPFVAIIPNKSLAHIKHNKMSRFPYQPSNRKQLCTLENYRISIILKMQLNISRIPQIARIKIVEVLINMLFKLSADRYHKQSLTKNIQGIHQWKGTDS